MAWHDGTEVAKAGVRLCCITLPPYLGIPKRKQMVARCDVDERELIRSGRCGACKLAAYPALPCPALFAWPPTSAVPNAHLFALSVMSHSMSCAAASRDCSGCTSTFH